MNEREKKNLRANNRGLYSLRPSKNIEKNRKKIWKNLHKNFSIFFSVNFSVFFEIEIKRSHNQFFLIFEQDMARIIETIS